MTAPRNRQWYTVAGRESMVQTHTEVLVDVPGTVEMIVGDIVAMLPTTPPAAWTTVAWILHVGTAAPDATILGADDEKTMWHEVSGLVNPGGPDDSTPVRPLRVRTEGMRIIETGEALRLRFDASFPVTDWIWAWSLRVLLLEPA